MLNTYIKNIGTTKTIVLDNNSNHINEINWDADYNGEIAKISIDSNSNGESEHFDIKLDNNDLANLLNIQSVNMPIDKRLRRYFDDFQYEPTNYFIELPANKLKKKEYMTEQPDLTLEKIIDRRISSPKSDEIFLPISNNIKKNKIAHASRKKHKQRKTHVTHKLLKKTKSKTSRTKSRNKTSKNSLPIFDLI